MLFDIEDYRYWGLIGNSKVPEKKLPNKIGVQDWVPVSGLAVDSSAAFRWNFKAISRYFQSAIKVLPFHKKEDAVNAYFNYLDASREYSIKWDIFQNMLISLPVKSVTGGKQFVEGDLFYVEQRSSFQTPENEAVYLYTPDRGNSFAEWQREYDKQYLLGVSFERVAVFVEDLNSLEEYYKTRVYTYVPLSETIAEEYYQSVRDLMASQKILLEKVEGMDVVLHEIPVPVKIDKIKFKHTLAVGGTFSGSIKTSTGYVKFVIGSEEFIFGDGTPSIIPFSISVLDTSKKSGYFFACDSVGEPIGDVTQIEIDATSELSSLNTSLATELTRLVAAESNLISLNLSKNTLLQFVDVATSPNLATLNLTGCTLLEYLRLEGCSVSSLNLSGMTALEYLNAADNKLGSVNFTGLTSLTTIDIGGNFIMPSSRTTMLSTLDSTGVNAGTLIAPLEGLKPEADVYYDSLITKGWNLTSDGVALPNGLYYSKSSSATYTSFEYITSTGYAKLTGSFGSIIGGNGSTVSISDIDNLDLGNQIYWTQSFNLSELGIFSPLDNDFIIQSCDATGNLTGEIYGLGGNQISNIDYVGVDLTKIKYIAFFDCTNLPSSLIQDCVNVRDLIIAYNNNDVPTTIDFSLFNSETVKYLFINDCQNIDFINIESLTSLYYINFTNTKFLSTSGVLDLSSFPNLQVFYFNQLGIPVADQSLTSFIASSNNLSNIRDIRIMQCEAIDTIDLGIIESNLDIALMLQYINLSSDAVSTFSIPLGLKSFYNSYANIPEVDYSSLYKITDLQISLANPSSISSIIIDSLPTLRYFDIDANSQPLSISVTNCADLRSFYTYSASNVSSYTISNLPLLNSLYAGSLGINSTNGISFEIDGGFSNLYNINLSGSRFSSLKLKNINVQYCYLQNTSSPNNCGLDFTGSRASNLNLYSSNLGGTLNLTNTKFVQGDYIHGSYSRFTNINLTNSGNSAIGGGFDLAIQYATVSTISGSNSRLRNFYGDRSSISSIDFSGYSQLRHVGLSYCNSLSSVNLSNAFSIENGWGGTLYLYETTVNSINLSNSNLGDFTARYCYNITSLDFSTVNSAVLRWINANGSQYITSVTGLTNKNKLRTINISQTNITSLDLTGSSNADMRTIRVDYTLFTPTATDNLINQIHTSLPSGWGYLGIRNNRTSASNAGFSNIQSKGWSINLSS